MDSKESNTPQASSKTVSNSASLNLSEKSVESTDGSHLDSLYGQLHQLFRRKQYRQVHQRMSQLPEDSDEWNWKMRYLWARALYKLRQWDKLSLIHI